MKFYSLSIFLDNNYFEQCKNIFSNRKNIETNEFEIIDPKNNSSKVFEVMISDFSLLFLPSNDFHKNMDFEIGITSNTIDEWNNFIEDITNNKKMEIETNYSENIEGLYAVIGPKDIHGPFFYIFDGKYSEVYNLLKINGEIGEKEYIFYKKFINKIITNDILKKIKLRKNKYNRNKIRNIRIKISGKIDIENKSEAGNIKIKQKKNSFEIIFK